MEEAPVQDEQRSQPIYPERDGLTIAFELVFTPAVFGLGGYGLDRWLGTSPIFLVVLTLVSLTTVVGLTIWRYTTEVDRQDSERRATQAARGPRAARWERHLVPASDADQGTSPA